MALLLSPVQAQHRYTFQHPQMGTTFNLVLYASDSTLAHRAADAAMARIDSLNQHLSDYVPDSELNRLSATAGTDQAVPVGDDLWTVLHTAYRLSESTNGAFDVTIGPLTRRWRRAIRRNILPEPAALDTARQTVGFRFMELDSTNQTVTLTRPGMRLDLGGIAKGYAVDEALEVIQSFGITSALVDGGGDIALGAPPPDQPGWRIALTMVAEMDTLIEEHRFLSNAAIATSGDTYRFLEVDGVRYSHIVDPHTGIGLRNQSRVTVIASTGMQADALASALSVLGPEAGLSFIETRPDVDVRFIERDGEHYRQHQSDGFEFRARQRME